MPDACSLQPSRLLACVQYDCSASKEALAARSLVKVKGQSSNQHSQTRSPGSLSDAEGFWLKAGLPLEAVDMYTKAGELPHCLSAAACSDCSHVSPGEFCRDLVTAVALNPFPTQRMHQRQLGGGAEGREGLPAWVRAQARLHTTTAANHLQNPINPQVNGRRRRRWHGVTSLSQSSSASTPRVQPRPKPPRRGARRSAATWQRGRWTLQSTCTSATSECVCVWGWC